MKILTTSQIRSADEATLKSQDIISVALIERVGTLCFNWIDKQLKGNPVRLLLFCGVRNNGGDGLVIARHLFQHGYNVSCYVVNFSETRSEEFLVNYNLLKELGESSEMINSNEDIPTINEEDIVIDCIFGIGLTRAISGFTNVLIDSINKSKAYTLAIDVPSGMFLDRTNSEKSNVLVASHTLTFSTPKLPFFLPDYKESIQSWEVLDIALDDNFLNSVESKMHSIEKWDITKILKTRNKFSHKGTFGHALIIGGSFGKIGAVTLSSKAALKVGSGLVTVYIPKCGFEILQISNPEIMVEVGEDNYLEIFNFKSNPNVIGIGPGMGTSKKTFKGFSKFLKENKLPLVIDADAINLLSKQTELLVEVPENSILTPHPKELERLIGTWENDFDKIKKTKVFSIKYQVIMVVKGAHTMIIDRENMYFNTTGNPALATAGSGDVLLGLITGLLAQKYTALEACMLGVYLHGLSADIGILERESVETFTASSIIENLGLAFKSLSLENREVEEVG
jgi:hydroxyethylthiazole kinase-like uncharacterized protein yjeF